MPSPIHPCFPEFVVALFLAKSRPAEVPVRGRELHFQRTSLHSLTFRPEYVANLRSYIRDGHRPKENFNNARHIDTQAFWKDSYQRLQQEMNEQRARIFSLERELDAVRSAGSHSPAEAPKNKSVPDPVTNGFSKKRKRGHTNGPQDHPVAGPKVASDAAPASSPDTPPNPRVQREIVSTLTHTGSLDDPANDLLNGIYALQKSRSEPTFATSSTAGIILFIISMIRRCIIPTEPVQETREVVATSSSPDTNFQESPAPVLDGDVMFPSSSPLQPGGSHSNVQPRVTVIEAAALPDNGRGMSNERLLDATTGRTVFSVIVAAIEKLGHSSDGDRIQGQLIIATIKLLKDMLDRICHLAAATPNETQEQTHVAKKPRSTRGKKLTMSQPLEFTPVEGIMRICGFLTSALQSLPQGRLAAEAIKEGFMFFLLRKIGDVLKAFVFGEDDEMWNAVIGQQDGTAKDSSECDNVRQEKLLVKQRQAPYLIWLLERSMACFTVDAGSSGQSQTGSQAVRNLPKTVRQGILTQKVKTQLQDTILKVVLGDDLQEFKSSLEERLDPEIYIEPWPAIRQADVVDHFKAEVWRLVGWDCLKDHIRWDNR